MTLSAKQEKLFWMKFGNTNRSFWLGSFLVLTSFCLSGQKPKPLNTAYISAFEKALSNDISFNITGERTILLKQITTPEASSIPYNDDLLIVSNAIKNAVSNSSHHLALDGNKREKELQSLLSLVAEVFRTKNNDIITFIYIIDSEQNVLFSSTYSLKGKFRPSFIPSIRLNLNTSIQPELNVIELVNQGQDTVILNFPCIIYGLKVQGMQKAFLRDDLKFGYFGELLIFQPINGFERSPFNQLNLGVATEGLISKFQLFGAENILTMSNYVSSNFSSLDLGQINLGSEFQLYVSKNLGLQIGAQLANRTLSLPRVTLPGIAKFDRFYFGLSLSL